MLENIAIDAQYIKSFLAFQTLTPAMLGKLATIHERVFFLGKNCSCTLLPGSIWLQPLITRLNQFQNTFCFFKMCWRFTGLSKLYNASQPPVRHTRYLNINISSQSSNASRLFSVWWYFLWCLSDPGIVFHITITYVNNLFPDFALHAVLLRFRRKTAKILWDLILTSYKIDNLPARLLFNKKTYEDVARKNLVVICIGNNKANFSWEKYMGIVERTETKWHAKFGVFSTKFTFYQRFILSSLKIFNSTPSILGTLPTHPVSGREVFCRVISSFRVFPCTHFSHKTSHCAKQNQSVIVLWVLG